MPETHKKEKEEKKKKLMEEHDEPEKKLSVSLLMFVQINLIALQLTLNSYLTKFTIAKVDHSTLAHFMAVVIFGK